MAKVRYREIAEQVSQVCGQAGRNADDVTVIAVSKTVGADTVQDAIAEGARDFGENRPDQLMEKADRFPEVRWHFIGNIQSRRIRDIVGRAKLIHSLYQESHARKISDIALEHGIVQDVLVEANVSGEESKSGLEPSQVADFVKACADMPGIRVRGLMTMAPIGDAETARATFDGLARLLGETRAELSPEQAACFTELSMGMTDDWREAIPAGATYVRIGRAIFPPETR